MKSLKFAKIQMSKLKRLFTGRCVFRIQDVAHCPIICQHVMQTEVAVLNLVAGSMTCRSEERRVGKDRIAWRTPYLFEIRKQLGKEATGMGVCRCHKIRSCAL